MDNDFFAFVKTYWEDISAFFDALFAFFKSIFDKATAGDTDTEE